MARSIYVVAPGTPINASVIAAANGAEIAQGIPPRLIREGITGTYPFTYTEPDDPERTPLQQAFNQLRASFKQNRNAAQVNDSLDAITVVLRQIRSELKP